MINLTHIEKYNIDMSKFNHVLHDTNISELEKYFSAYVGAKYACGVNSATSAIYLALQNKKTIITLPTMIPPVVVNAIITSGNNHKFCDNVGWVGNSYILHDFGDYKIIDSAQKVEKNQFKKEANDEDLMIFSFYPTKPVGSLDGGMVVSNDKNKIDWFKKATLNGMGFAKNNWERGIEFPGWKMYLNSFQAEIAYKNLLKLNDKQVRLNEIKNIYNREFKLNNTSNHLYRINVNNRDKFISYMKKNDIICGIHYNTLHDHPVYKTNDECPNSELLSKITVSIPFHEKLSNINMKKIIEKIKIWNKNEKTLCNTSAWG